MSLTRQVGDDGDALLWRQLHEGSVSARERLFALHSDFARKIALKRYRQRANNELELAEIRQLAYAGLLEAIDRFDPTRGAKFETFATHRIEGSIADGLAHLTERREQVAWRRRIHQKRLATLKSGDPGRLSASEAMEALAELAVGLAISFMLEDTGMVVPSDDQMARPRRTTAYDSTAWQELVGRLTQELSALPEREQKLLRYHYAEDTSFDQLASLLAISRTRVMQLHREALALLRKRLASRGHFRLEG